MPHTPRPPAGIDPLTTLPTWGAIVDAADAEFQRGRRAGTPLAVALVEIDRLGSLRQAHGGIAADTVIRHVAVAFRSRMRKAELIGRYGDDGFLLVFPGGDPGRGVAGDRTLVRAGRRGAQPAGGPADHGDGHRRRRRDAHLDRPRTADQGVGGARRSAPGGGQLRALRR